jgi:hypothetical protein
MKTSVASASNNSLWCIFSEIRYIVIISYIPYKPPRRGAMEDIVVHRKRSASEFYDRYLIRKILNIQSADPRTAVVKATADGGHDGQQEHTMNQ